MEQGAKILSVWNKLPLIIRAILIGFSVSTLGVILWGLVATLIPIPWSFILMVGLLGLYIIYFSGSRWSERTKRIRKNNFRLTILSKRVWFWSLVAAALIVIIEQSGLVITFRIIEFPAERFSIEYGFLENVPSWAAWLFIIMISAVAGICEETGFRGYMQVPLEERYGPIMSIGIVSIVFVIVHLHQAWAGPILIHIFFISVLFGALAYGSGSLLPGMIAHVAMDLFNFSFWWSTLGGQFEKSTIAETGVDSHFVLFTLIFAASLIIFILITLKILIKRD